MSAIKSFFAALQFLTFVPVSSRLSGGDLERSNSVIFFPLIGLIIGAAIASLDALLNRFIHAPLLFSAIAVLSMVVVSRGLHLDGLADTADGFLSSRSRERVLEIMRDSRIGAFGALAITSIILLKWSAVASLDRDIRWPAIALAPVAGRASLVFQLALLKNARGTESLADVFQRKCGPLQFIFALAVLFAAGWFSAAWLGLVVAASVFVFVLAFALYCARKVGGLTGDTLGAGCELAELAALLAFAIGQERC